MLSFEVSQNQHDDACAQRVPIALGSHISTEFGLSMNEKNRHFFFSTNTHACVYLVICIVVGQVIIYTWDRQLPAKTSSTPRFVTRINFNYLSNIQISKKTKKKSFQNRTRVLIFDTQPYKSGYAILL